MARRDFDFTKALRSPVDQIPAEIIVTVPDGTVSDPVESFRDVELRLAQHELIDEILRNDPDLFTETRQSSDDNRESHMDDPIFMQQRRKVLESTLTKVVKPRWKQTVLDRMTDKLNGGPMTLLNDCVNNPTRVKVYIRRRDGLRSILTGFVVAFDHHFNLVLRDVDEIYYRLKTKKAFFRNDGKFKKTLFTVPEVLKYDYVSRLDSNHEILQRHLNQILVTGDNVVLIATNS